MVEAKNRLGAVYILSVAKAANLLNLSISYDSTYTYWLPNPKVSFPVSKGL